MAHPVAPPAARPVGARLVRARVRPAGGEPPGRRVAVLQDGRLQPAAVHAGLRRTSPASLRGPSRAADRSACVGAGRPRHRGDEPGGGDARPRDCRRRTVAGGGPCPRARRRHPAPRSAVGRRVRGHRRVGAGRRCVAPSRRCHRDHVRDRGLRGGGAIRPGLEGRRAPGRGGCRQAVGRRARAVGPGSSAPRSSPRRTGGGWCGRGLVDPVPPRCAGDRCRPGLVPPGARPRQCSVLPRRAWRSLGLAAPGAVHDGGGGRLGTGAARPDPVRPARGARGARRARPVRVVVLRAGTLGGRPRR